MEHLPVLLQPVLEALDVQSDGTYIDATFGRGGHSSEILRKIGTSGRLFAFDQDPDAIRVAEERFGSESRFAFYHGSFAMLKTVSEDWGIYGGVNGILMDLGVSSPQLDDPHRGFSFMHDGPLDMRMNNSVGMTASEWLMLASEKEISDVLWRYGEERYARPIARRIVAQRSVCPIISTKQLAELIEEASPRKERHKNPATRSFQAIRIFINRELEILHDSLLRAVDVLAIGGRLVVISFHSLEDRIVKRCFRDLTLGQMLPRGLPVKSAAVGQRVKTIGKPTKPNALEIEKNPRARSAVMRVVEKI